MAESLNYATVSVAGRLRNQYSESIKTYGGTEMSQCRSIDSDGAPCMRNAFFRFDYCLRHSSKWLKGIGIVGALFVLREILAITADLTGLGILPDFVSKENIPPHIVGVNKTVYSHSELRSEAEKLLSRMKEYITERQRQERECSDAYQHKIMRAQSDEEKKKIREAESLECRRNVNINTEYNEKFRSDVILIRDKMLSRLPKEERNQSVPYEHPVTYFALWDIITDLERLSKNLPK